MHIMFTLKLHISIPQDILGDLWDSVLIFPMWSHGLNLFTARLSGWHIEDRRSGLAW